MFFTLPTLYVTNVEPPPTSIPTAAARSLPELVKLVIRVESNFEPRAISSKGARGLMQLMPATAKLLGVQDVFDVGQNIDGGVLRAGLPKRIPAASSTATRPPTARSSTPTCRSLDSRARSARCSTAARNGKGGRRYSVTAWFGVSFRASRF